MKNIRYVLVGTALAFLLCYIISYIYNMHIGQADVSEIMRSDRRVCVYDGDDYALMDVEEYTSLVLAGMMDDSWGDEMLKTMAVIIRTGIYYQMDMVDQSASDDTGTGGNLINESRLREIRYSYQELKRLWGHSYDQVLRRSRDAVADTVGRVMKYDGKIIMPAYHIVSVGHTVSAEEMYGYDIPYLRQVSSDADRGAETFSSTLIYSDDRLRKEFQSDIDGSGKSSEDVKVTDATTSGFAKSIDVFGAVIDAEEFKDKLGLLSTNIHIDKVDSGYRIITVGVGDSLGLSVYGADILAKNGESYRDILAYYYSGVDITR